MASLPAKLTESAWLYQPLASAARAGVEVAPGAVLSTLKVFETEVIPPSLSAVQVSVMPVVSALSVRASQPSVDRMIDSGSTMLQLTVTVVTYHPFEPSVPEMIGVTTGGVGSPGTSGAVPAAPGVSSRPTTTRVRMAA